jgi:hypothetical protein
MALLSSETFSSAQRSQSRGRRLIPARDVLYVSSAKKMIKRLVFCSMRHLCCSEEKSFLKSLFTSDRLILSKSFFPGRKGKNVGRSFPSAKNYLPGITGHSFAS